MNHSQNLSVPFNIPIPGGVSPGKMIIIHGAIPPMSQRFAVNLLTASRDIALHVCPRFKENRVVRNTVQNMIWGSEESHGSLPLYPGQGFDIMILCEAYDFKIAINGRHFTEFSHRLPYSSITNLAVDGEVSIHNVEYKDQNNFGNNNFSNPTPYGFQPGPPSPNYNNPGGLYPSGSLYPPPQNSGYNPNSGGPQYPNSTSPLYPVQPGYGNVPHQGPYPQMPNSHPGAGYTPTPHTKPGLLDQAGMALAGVLGPGLLAGGMNKNCSSGGGCAKRGLLDEAGRALAGVFGGGSGLSGTTRSQRGMPHSSTSFGRSGILSQAGSALADALGGGGLVRNGHYNKHNKKLGMLGGTLGTAVAGAALTGHLNPVKAAKKQRKAQKKALKYGLPLAGAGLGAYALHKGLHKGFRRSSSSSSSSSD